MSTSVRRVHVVAKTHLDLGFTALAHEVVDRYVNEYFPRAVAVARQLRLSNSPLGLVWTTGSWILREALDRHGTPREQAAIASAIRHGDLAWHGLPLTFHTELMDADLFRHGLSIASGLDARFGRRTIAAKMTDVPGHTRAMVPLLAEAGIRFLHLGVNPVWPVPSVPPVFRWRALNGSEVVVAYQGGYGGDVVIDGCGDVLSFLHSGDNLGPPSMDDVHGAYRTLAKRYPEATIVASTLDDFARALLASGVAESLPVVTSEIGDPWIFGAASDPQKLAGFRRLLRARRAPMLDVDRRPAIDDALLLVAEHTWGIDEKSVLPDPGGWNRAGLGELRSSDAGQRMEASWQEQRDYVADAVRLMRDAGIHPEPEPRWTQRSPVGDGHDGWRRVEPGADIALGARRVTIDATSGAIVGLVDSSGRVLADRDHRLGELFHQTFDEADYARFYNGLRVDDADAWWAVRDNTKPGIDAAGARSAITTPMPNGVWVSEPDDAGTISVVVRARFDDAASTHFGAPPTVFTRWTFPARTNDVEAMIAWTERPASRLPEALWCSWNPVVAEPNRWTMDKLGVAISPLDVLRHGGRRLHGVGDGLAYEGPDGSVRLATPDAALVAPGGPDLLDADPELPDLGLGFGVLLHDNCWGTNFPMWNEGPAAFRFSLTVA